MTFKEILLQILKEAEEDEKDKDKGQELDINNEPGVNKKPPIAPAAPIQPQSNVEKPKEDPNLVDPNKPDLTPIDPGPGQEPKDTELEPKPGREPEQPTPLPDQVNQQGQPNAPTVVDTIGKDEAKYLIKNTKGRFFTAKFIKKNGQLRVMNCRLGVKAYLHGMEGRG